MAENKNLKNVIFWLMSQEMIDSQEEFAEKLGYNPSSVSQVVTGVKPLSDKFIAKIVGFCDKINPDYFHDKGEMLKIPDDLTSPAMSKPVGGDTDTESDILPIPREVWDAIQTSLIIKDKQINRILSILSEEHTMRKEEAPIEA